MLGSTTPKISYLGNGSTNVYAFPFKIVLKADIVAEIRNPAGVKTTLVLDTDYTIPTASLLVSNGGNITLVNLGQAWIDGSGFLKTNYTLTFRRVKVLNQGTSFRNQSDYYPENHEDALDKLMMISQQLNELCDRAIKLPENLDSGDFNPLLPEGIMTVLEPTFLGVDQNQAMVLGPTFASVFQAVSDAQAAASAAAASATSASNDAAAAAASAAASAASAAAAAVSAAAALVSENNAAASAASAAASAASVAPLVAATETISNGGNVTVVATNYFQQRPVVGNAGPVIADDQLFGINPANFVNGMEITLIGTDDINYVETNPADVLYGLIDPMGMVRLKKGVMYKAVYNSTLQRFYGGRLNV